LICHLVWNLPYFERRVHTGHKLTFYIMIFIVIALSQALLIEPSNNIDKAMHIHEGKLPDLVIFEGEEPVDAIMKWAKLAAKDHHPIVREPIYWDILDKVCREIVTKCSRRRAWESIDMGAITVFGISHKITYFNPNVDRRFVCKLTSFGIDYCVHNTAETLCDRIYPKLPQCLRDITMHITSQLNSYNSKRMDSKDTYIKLGLEMDAPHKELYLKLGFIVRSNGLNISPFSRVDNGTTSYPRWDMHTTTAFSAIDAHEKVRDPKKRLWNDKPCTPYFGGALCAKTDDEGNMIIDV